MTAIVPRQLSVVEMQAALAAAWRGEFTDPARGKVPPSWGKVRESGTGEVTEHGGRYRPGVGEGHPTTLPAAHLTGQMVLVLAAHSGAGASTVAVLLCDAVAGAGVRTRLIECADPVRSGIAAATDTELGEDGLGWRQGRRGDVRIDRLAAYPLNLPDVPLPPRDSHDTDRSVTVVDAGWPAWDVVTADRWVTGLLDTSDLVVVCRSTVSGVGQAEHLLAALPGGRPVVAVLGPSAWPGVVRASCGPLLNIAREERRVVPVPLDKRIAVTGLTAAPLPNTLTAAGRELAGLVLPDLAISAGGKPFVAPRATGSRNR